VSPLRKTLAAHLGQVLTPEVAAAIDASGMLSFSLDQRDKESCAIYERLGELLGDDHAVTFLRDLAFVVHIWDDLVDGDKAVTPQQVTSAFTKAIVGFGSNPFFIRHSSQLAPVLHAGILNWQGANQLEAIGTPHALQVSHVVRCGVGDVAVLAAALLHGDAYAAKVAAELRMLMQQDSFEDYTADFRQGDLNAQN
jgi:hypothetical protein